MTVSWLQPFSFNPSFDFLPGINKPQRTKTYFKSSFQGRRMLIMRVGFLGFWLGFSVCFGIFFFPFFFLVCSFLGFCSFWFCWGFFVCFGFGNFVCLFIFGFYVCCWSEGTGTAECLTLNGYHSAPLSRTIFLLFGINSHTFCLAIFGT